MHVLKNIWKVAGMPLLVLCLLGILWVVWQGSGLPTDEALISRIKTFFDQYGLLLIFVSALLEGTLFLGLYYPGGLVLFLGVMFVHDSIQSVITVVIFVCIGLFVAHSINYMLGKHGWYRLLSKFGLETSIQHAQEKLTRYGSRAIYLSYWHPNVGAVIATAAGILHFPIKKFLFYSAIAILGWNAFWGTMAYLMGDKALNFIGIRFALITCSVWLLYRVVSYKHYLSLEVELLGNEE